MRPVIEVNDLTRDYGGGKGVFGLSFQVGDGEAFGFLGPNGAGKTTTIRHLMGFLRPESGSCRIGGLDCWRSSSAVQKNLGYIPGEIAFFSDMTGTEFLSFLSKYKNSGSMGRSRELLDMFELDPKMRIKKMSKGMKQKVGIVAALFHDPGVLILDEPTSGLDPLMQSRFIDLIASEKKRGKTILMSSHMFEEVERTCHRVSIIRNGRLAAVDSVDALKAAQSKKYIVTLESDDAAMAFAAECAAPCDVGGSSVTVTVSGGIKEFIDLLGRHPVINLSAPSQSLEEIFMQFYGGDK